jgi:hypothetical protein
MRVPDYPSKDAWKRLLNVYKYPSYHTPPIRQSAGRVRIMTERSWTSENRRNILAGAAVIVASLTVLNLKTSTPWPQLISPVMITLSALWWLRLIYFWRRKASFDRREKRKNKNPAAKLDIPPGLKTPEQYDGGQILHSAQWAYLESAVKAQGKYFANGILVAILPPMALLLLSFQLLALPKGGSWAVGLIMSEVSCLVILVYVALTNREPTAEWIENRIRTELFRREQYLCLVGIGPYLLRDSSEGVREALRRRGQIEGADAHSLVGLVPLQERNGLTWMEALHHKGAPKLAARSDLLERMESYRFYRIGKQLMWFANEIRDSYENEQIWSRMLTGALLAAIAIAALHAFDLVLNEAHAVGKGADIVTFLGTLVGTLAIVLPPLGTAFLSIRAMYNFRGRSRIYQHEKGLLLTHQGALEALIEEIRQLPVGTTDLQLNKIDFQFRAIALRTEQSLSFELSQWALLMERNEAEVGP